MSILAKTLKGIIGRKNSNLVPFNSMLPSVENVRQMEGGAIIAFTAGSEGDALASLTRDILQSFSNLATSIKIIDINDPKWLVDLNDVLCEPIWFIYSFFGTGQGLQVATNEGPKNFWEMARIPFLRVYGDTPAYFPEKHVGRYLNSINLYGDKSFSSFYQRWFDNPTLSLHAPPLSIGQRPLNEVDRDLKLSGSIIFPKNGNSPSDLISYWRTSLPAAIARMLESMVEECVSIQKIDSELHIDEMAIRYFEDIGIDLTFDRSLLCFLVAQVDDYIRRYKSTLVVESILDLPVVVCGKNWEHIDFHGKRAVLQDNSNYMSTSAQLDGALALLDMSPNIVHAPHDRVCRAIGRGTAFLTNRQQFMEQFNGPLGTCTYSFNKESIESLVGYYIQNPINAVELGIEQSKIFREIYTPERHVKVVLAAVHLMSLRLNGRPWGTQNFVDFG